MNNSRPVKTVDQAEFKRLEIASKRKPRIALMGEFSAGKSTLMNLLMGTDTLPTQVTATQLPPVWFKYGTDEPYRVDVDGNYHEIDLTNMTDTPVRKTRYIQVFLETDILEVCDLIDTPVISDPNIPAEVWERAVHHADGVIWCTHATQAWRQSENAAWSAMPKRLRENSLLLLTRADKLVRPEDRERLLKRIDREAAGLFADRYPVALLEAIAAGEDYDKWVASGADAFVNRLIDIIENNRKKRASLMERYRVHRDVEISRPSKLRMTSQPAPFRSDNSQNIKKADPVSHVVESPKAAVDIGSPDAFEFSETPSQALKATTAQPPTADVTPLKPAEAQQQRSAVLPRRVAVKADGPSRRPPRSENNSQML